MVGLRVHPLAPVAALDIDGTLADYYKHFHWFAQLYKQTKLEVDWDRAFEGEFSQALGLDKSEYRQIKLAYRQGGMKRSLPVLDAHVRYLVNNLRERLGLRVFICTTRPWQRLDNIDPDTQFWINRNLGRVDGVIYGEEKYLDLIDIVGLENIVGVVDDLPENYLAAKSAGLNVTLMAGYHNRWWRESWDDGHDRKPKVVYDSFGIEDQMKEWKNAR